MLLAKVTRVALMVGSVWDPPIASGFQNALLQLIFAPLASQSKMMQTWIFHLMRRWRKAFSDPSASDHKRSAP